MRDGDSTGAVSGSIKCEVPRESDEIRLSEPTEDEGHSREVDGASSRDSPGLNTEGETS